MNKVFTVIIKAKSTLTQFLCNAVSVSATPPGQHAVDDITPAAATVARSPQVAGSVPGAPAPHQPQLSLLELSRVGQVVGPQETPVCTPHTCWARGSRAAPWGQGHAQYCRGGEGATPPGLGGEDS